MIGKSYLELDAILLSYNLPAQEKSEMRALLLYIVSEIPILARRNGIRRSSADRVNLEPS
jgi:hypothetical protein